MELTELLKENTIPRSRIGREPTTYTNTSYFGNINHFLSSIGPPKIVDYDRNALVLPHPLTTTIVEPSP